jgi:parallel beta-helix repeat protein
MKTRLTFFLVFLALLLTLGSIRDCQFETKASTEMRVRNLDTGLDYASIQAAIDAPETLNGHTIFVEEGIYHENLHMNKSLSLLGENREKTVVDGDGNVTSTDYDYVLMIEETSNVIVKGFTFQNSRIGVFLVACNLSRISDNRMRDCSWYGTWVYESSNNLIDGNVLDTNHQGILLALAGASDNVLFGNAFYNNLDAGIRVYWASSNSIVANWIGGNPKGIQLQFAAENQVEANTFEDNAAGTFLTSSNDNTLFHNNYVNNTQNVVVDESFGGSSSDNWDAGYPAGGNYWSNLNGTDFFGGPYQDEEGSDGIADTSYVIDEENKDAYPLMIPFIPQIMSGDLFERDFQLQTDYADLSHVYDRLLSNFTKLQANYKDLQAASNYLNATHKATIGELDRLRDLTHVLTVMTPILSGTTAVLTIVAYRRRHTVGRTD